MAYPSTTTWRTTANTTATPRKDSVSTISTSFLFFSAVNYHNPHVQNCKRSRLIASSSVDPSCSTCNSSSITHVTNSKKAKSSKDAESFDGSFSIFSVDDDPSDGLVKEEKMITLNGGEHVELAANVKKRPFWQKILFASNKLKSILLLNIVTVVYASDIPVVKTVEATMDPAAFSAMRFVMSAIPFLPFVFRARDDVKTRNAGMELGLWVSLGYLVEALGLLTADAGRASFISLFTVIVVPLLDGMLGAIIPVRTWFGVLMSGLGVAMLECSGSPPNVGDLLNFLSAIFFGIHMLRTEHFSRSTKKENFLPLLGYEICVIAVLSTFWVILGGWFDGVEEIEQSPWTWEVLWDWVVSFPWIPALYTGIFSTGLCLWVEIAAMRDVSATETAIIYGLEPLWGAGFAWFLLGERWGTVGWIGATLVLGGSLMVQIFGSSTPSISSNAEENKPKCDLLLVSEKQKLRGSLSTSPVVVRSRKDRIDML